MAFTPCQERAAWGQPHDPGINVDELKRLEAVELRTVLLLQSDAVPRAERRRGDTILQQTQPEHHGLSHGCFRADGLRVRRG